MKYTIEIIKTLEGKYVGQVLTRNDRGHVTTHYETAEYVTRQMAVADAKCWKAFHVNNDESKSTEYTIDETDYVMTDRTNGGKPSAEFTGREFADLIGRRMKAYPGLTFQIGQEYGGRKMTNGHFFLILKNTPTSRGNVYRVYKGGKAARDNKES